MAFTPVGSAPSAPTDTQICSYLSAFVECPVDLLSFIEETPDSFTTATSATTGAREAISFLELRFSLNPEGALTPVLEEWNVTYSCLFDE
jgi:hypothetical protein